MASSTILAVVLLYLVALFAIGVWGGRGSSSIGGYYIADKKLPSWVIAFSSNATGESAWLLLGLTGMGYTVGVHAFWIVLGEVAGVALAWVFVARPFKEATDRFRCITVPDYLEERFEDRKHVIRIISAFIIFSMVTAYTAAQLTAAGKAFQSFLGTGYATGVFIGAGVVLFYTTVGGFKAVAYSDLLQGLLMLGCLITLPVVGFFAAGGWWAVVERLREQDPHLLLAMGHQGTSVAGVISALGFVAIGLAFLGAPQLLSRFMSARDQREIVSASVLAVACIVVFDVGAVLSGMAGRALFPALDDPETILPVMSGELFPAVFAGVFLVVVLAAMMSTVDSLLILASSALVRDIIQKTFNSRASEFRLSLIGKFATVVLGGVALILAVGEARVIFWFVLFAWSGLACSFGPVVLCSLFWKGTTRAGAVAGMTGGFVATVVWALFFKQRFYNLYEMLPGVLVGLFLTVTVSLMTTAPPGAAAELENVRGALRLRRGRRGREDTR